MKIGFIGLDKILPVLTTMGRRVLHTGDLGSASMLKVMTNYLAIAISSGNSFVHETEEPGYEVIPTGRTS